MRSCGAAKLSSLPLHSQYAVVPAPRLRNDSIAKDVRDHSRRVRWPPTSTSTPPASTTTPTTMVSHRADEAYFPVPTRSPPRQQLNRGRPPLTVWGMGPEFLVERQRLGIPLPFLQQTPDTLVVLHTDSLGGGDNLHRRVIDDNAGTVTVCVSLSRIFPSRTVLRAHAPGRSEILPAEGQRGNTVITRDPAIVLPSQHKSVVLRPFQPRLPSR